MSLADQIRAAVRNRGGHVEATTRDILQIIQPRLDKLTRERDAYAGGTLIRRGAGPAQPGQPLTPRETAVLQLIATGHTNTAAATALGIRVGSVQQRLRSAFAKLGVHDRAHAVYLAIATGQLTTSSTDHGDPQ